MSRHPRNPRFLKKNQNFSCYIGPDFLQYLSEEPNQKSRQTRKDTSNMKTGNPLTKLMLLSTILRFCNLLFAGPILVLALTLLSPTKAQGQTIGINMVLNQAPSNSILQDLGAHGQVLDVIPQINGVRLRALASELPAVQSLPYVAGANPDAQVSLATDSDLSDGTNHWSLDAVNVTDFGATPPRVVAYDGEGVYVGVIDTGLIYNWQAYFPEDRIDMTHARAYEGGGQELGTVSSQPERWGHDTSGHGTAVTSIILGFRYALTDPPLPNSFNGVAPKATVIPVKTHGEGPGWYSTIARGLVYLTDLKINGDLGNSPLVVNMSFGSFEELSVQSVVNYFDAGFSPAFPRGSHGRYSRSRPRRTEGKDNEHSFVDRPRVL
jgi:hypothetical protein